MWVCLSDTCTMDLVTFTSETSDIESSEILNECGLVEQFTLYFQLAVVRSRYSTERHVGLVLAAPIVY